MTRQEANEQGRHYRCGGKLQVGQRPKEGTVIWLVGVRCVKCKRQVMTRLPYQRWFQGDEAMADRRHQAIVSFNQGAPWEQED
ncbi:MAG: hypothetical protein H0U76_22610 [Ktedonobacteraceae bacterium]|nr:hypothetical protein [Ktedonobacteraceae bacterium]MBA3826133.1 hypothetical protein [Ktedonobacterales bacterium]